MDIMELSLRENSQTDLDAPPWMFGNSKVTWTSPPRPAAAVPAPRPEELDRVVRETMVEKLTERVHLQKRVDVVHHGGQPEGSESCGIVMRALWAVPLVFAAQGLKYAAKPLVGCCSMQRVPAESLYSNKAADSMEEGGDAALLAAKLAAKPEAPAPVPAPAVAAPAAAEAPGVLPSMAGAPGQPAAPVPPPQGGLGLGPSPGLGGAAPAPESGAAALLTGPGPDAKLQTVGFQEVEGAAAKEKPEKKRPKGDRGSAVSVSSNVQSSVGNLLAGYAKSGGSRRPAGPSSGASVIGAPSVIGGQPSVIGAGAPKGPPPQAAASSSGAASTSAGPPPAPAERVRTPPGPGSSASRARTPPPAAAAGEPSRTPAPAAGEPLRTPPGAPDGRARSPPATSDSEKRRREGGGGQSASKTVVSNFQSNSAASNLLGPMVARQGKQGKRGGGDAKSAVG